MLVLTRKPMESILFFVPGKGKITVTVTRIRGKQVSLGIESDDKNIIVKRSELLQKEKERRKANGSSQGKSNQR